MHIIKKLFEGKKLDEYHEYTYFEKQYGQIIPLDVCLFNKKTYCTWN